MIAAQSAAARERVFADPGCELVRGMSGRVEAIVDAATVRLEGGAELRLAGIEAVPPSAEVAAAAEALLTKRALGEVIEVRSGSVATDRYGRTVGHAYLASGAREVSLGVLLAGAGFVRVTAPFGDDACIGTLLDAERTARDAGIGLWPLHPALNAYDPALRLLDDGFALVEGRVLSIGRRERTVYLNFGRDWSTDFTVSMTAAVASAIEAAGGPLDALAGQRVRIRGLLSQRDGPWISVSGAWQIELLDDSDAR